jgi:hypothetical protein
MECLRTPSAETRPRVAHVLPVSRPLLGGSPDSLQADKEEYTCACLCLCSTLRYLTVRLPPRPLLKLSWSNNCPIRNFALGIMPYTLAFIFAAYLFQRARPTDELHIHTR